jgi:hypothetical protein
MTLQALGGGEFALRLVSRQRVAPPYWRSDTHTHMRPHILGTECVGFSKQDACGNLVVDSLPVIFPFPPFAEGFWCKRPLGERKSYLSFSQKSSN